MEPGEDVRSRLPRPEGKQILSLRLQSLNDHGDLQHQVGCGTFKQHPLSANVLTLTARGVPMEGTRVVFVLFLLIFLLSPPDTQRTTPSQQRESKHIIEEERHALAMLNHTRYGDFNPTKHQWLNLTGLRASDGYDWSLLPLATAKAREQAQAVLGATQIQSGEDAVHSLPHGEFGERYSNVADLDSGEKLPELIPFYQNVTGLIHGKWTRTSLGNISTAISPNLTALSSVSYITKEFNRNITGARGDLIMKLDERKGTGVQVGLNTAREIKAELTIQDKSSSGDGWEMILYGIHFIESGSILLTTSGEKFAGVFALPHFVRSNSTFDAAQQLLNETLLDAVEKQEAPTGSPSYPWMSSHGNPADIMFPTPHCEYIVYLQQHLVWPYAPSDGWRSYLSKTQSPSNQGYSHLAFLEDELRTPTGAPVKFVPDLRFSAVILSPDCGFVLESESAPDSWYHNPGRHLKGYKAEAFVKKVRRVIEMFCLLVAAQIFLLMRQMRDASTPSTKSRISYLTVAIMALGDGFAFLSAMVLSLFMESAFLTVVTVAFLAFLCVSFFGMKFLMDIWNVQAPERQERERQTQRLREQESNPVPDEVLSPSAQRAGQDSPNSSTAVQPSTSTNVLSAAGSDSLPLPATARPPRDTRATPVTLPPDQDIDAEAEEPDRPTTAGPGAQTTALGNARREMSQMYSRFYFILIALIFLSLNASTWPIAIRSIYTNLLALLYLSFWVPQIKRNVIRNCRKALRWEFVAGQSILRLMPFAYFYIHQDNVLLSKPDRSMLLLFISWVWAQVLFLISQETIGPRFFVPNGWAPPAYDYHPVLREDDEEAAMSMPVGSMQSSSSIESPLSPSDIMKERGKRTFDCAICMHNLEVPVIPRGRSHGELPGGGSITATIFTRRPYMVTPCRHIFHSVCLEGWMKYKLQCPICRESLPPL